LSGGDWILTPEHSILHHRLGGEEEKKRKKRKSSRVVAFGALFGMGFVKFYLFIIFFLEFVYGWSHVGLYLG
jgi:hypothetical protein